ncbi:hypothetical protein Tco_1411983 [Tanacetum coccineum]
MSTTSAHQQALADAGSETRSLMLERGSCIPWASKFKRYLDRKKETCKFLKHSIDEGPYQMKMIQPDPNQEERLQTEDDLTDSYANARDMWLRVKRLMQGTELSEIDRETWFNKEFDQFTTAPEESLTSVYNRFSQLINDLKRNNVILSNVVTNTKFLNCLHPEWYNYVTNVHLAKNVKEEQYDVLFDHLQEYERLVIASRAKKVAKTHDPLALVAHTSSSSSRSPPPYYVTHPPFVVDYDDDYQGDTFSNDQEDNLTSAMMLLARAITHLVQADRVNIQSRNVGYDGRIARRSYNTQEESAESSNVQKETGNVQRTLRTYSLGNATNVQCYNCSAKGHYERDFPKPRVRDSKYFMKQMLLAKKDKAGVILSNKHNDFLLVDAAQMEEIEELSVNICMIARIQQATTDFNEEPSYDSAFISEVHTPSTSFINPLFSNSDHEQTYQNC